MNKWNNKEKEEENVKKKETLLSAIVRFTTNNPKNAHKHNL